MEPQAKNLKFSYLYRDEGNYKDYGEVIFSNPCCISAEEATRIVRGNLIDGEFFYPKEWAIPLICGEYWMDNWYEFLDFSPAEEETTDPRTVEEFLGSLSKHKRKSSKKGSYES